MSERIIINISLTWNKLKNANGMTYSWGDEKDPAIDPNWLKPKVIYRWVKSSTTEIAEIGETKRELTKRVNNYISATSGSKAGATNKKVFAEQRRLSADGDSLYLEFVENVPGYNLSDNRQRKLAEHLLIGHYRPYLQ